MTASQARQGNSTSSVLGRRLGAELLKLRTTAGLTQPQAAKVLTASTAKVAKMEGGWVPVRDPDIRALCELYGVHDPGAVGALLELARVDRERRKAKGWWNDHPIHGVMQEYVSLESVATTIKAWQPAFIPGLLQTPAYATALRECLTTPEVKGPERDDEFVAARLARQQRLSQDSPLTLQMVVYEAVLHNLPGSATTAHGQLDHLLQMTELSNISIRIFPFGGIPHPGLNGPFNILSFAEPGAMDIVYAETPFTQRWEEGGDRALAYGGLFETISEHSLDTNASASLLRKLRRER
ncbi:helix-turn-helix domain-containing protein [Streptomyces sp. YIM S03343]